MRKLSAIIFIILLVATAWAAAQNLTDEFPRAQSLFARAQRLMSEKNYPAAIETYNELVKGFKNSQYRDIYQYGLARAYYLSGNFRNASQTLAPFHSLFPKSGLRPYAYQLEANCDYRLSHLEAAFRGYLRTFETADDNRLRSLSERSILATVEAGYVPPDSLIEIVPGSLSCQVKARVAYLMAQYWDDAKVDEFMGGCPKSMFKGDPHPKAAKGESAVGLMLPLSGPYAKYGQSILDGAMMAAEMLSQGGITIDLLTYDTRADNVTAAREAIALAESEVAMVVGPLLSNVAATTAAALSCRNVPVLVPAATQAGFTDLSPVCFQMSPNMEIIGRGMAQYAVKHRGMTTLAVITPTTLDEMTMAEAFAAEAERLGARVLAVEKFRPDETDFGPYINDIKEALIGPPDDSTFYITLDGDTLKAGEMPVTFDGMFMPATEQQLFLLLPQLNFYRVTTSYLGADEWNTAKVLKLGEKVLKDAVFYSSEAAMHHSQEYDQFAAAYDTRFAAEPGRLVALGYDAMNILATAYRAGRHGPEDLFEFLNSLRGYEGVSGRITFGRSRSNLDLPLFTLREGQVRPLIERPTVEEIPEDEMPPDSGAIEVIKYEY
jgi:ABC-type branched-subunit amino acid transport system substrate-binding protein